MNPADLNLTISPALTKAIPNHVGGKTVASAALGGSSKVERVNLEPIYTQLKTALGDNWSEYKLALSEFVKGRLNQSELSWVLQPILSPAPSVATTTDSSKSLSTLHIHNTLLAALYANSIRDPPPTDVAPWVVATDKPTSTSKSAGAGSVTNDKFEERQKHEVMGIAPRDRKRIKALKEVGKPVNDPFHEMQLYANELAVKSSSQTQQAAEPQSATAAGAGAATTSLARSNYDIEIRRRYAQTLASEALEFPSTTDIANRIEPICYEEGLTGGVQQGALPLVAELVEQATEVFFKEMLGSFLGHARSNGVGGEGIQTNKFRRQLRKEEDDLERGILQRNAGGMLPVEMEMQAKREPLDMQDLRLSLKLSDPYLDIDHFLDETIMLSQYPEMDSKPQLNGHSYGDGRPLTNGVKRSSTAPPDPDAMDIDGGAFDYGVFKGVIHKDHENNSERAACGQIQGNLNFLDRVAPFPTNGPRLDTLGLPGPLSGLVDARTKKTSTETAAKTKPPSFAPADEDDVLQEGILDEPFVNNTGRRKTAAPKGKKSAKPNAASAPPAEDSGDEIVVRRRTNKKRKRSVGSNFANDDEPPPPKTKVPRRKVRVETTDDEDDFVPETTKPAPKRKNPPKKNAKESGAAASKEKTTSQVRRPSTSKAKAKNEGESLPAVALGNPYEPGQLSLQKDLPPHARMQLGARPGLPPAGMVSVPQKQPRKAPRTEQSSGPSQPARKAPAAAQKQPRQQGGPEQSDALSKPVQNPAMAAQMQMQPRHDQPNQPNHFSQQPLRDLLFTQTHQQLMGSNKPSPMEARAKVSQNFASAYRTLPPGVSSPSMEDFNRTAAFQEMHRGSEARGEEQVGIGLPLGFVGGDADKAQSTMAPGAKQDGIRQASGQEAASNNSQPVGSTQMTSIAPSNNTGSLAPPSQTHGAGQDSLHQYLEVLDGRIEENKRRLADVTTLNRSPSIGAGPASSPAMQMNNSMKPTAPTTGAVQNPEQQKQYLEALAYAQALTKHRAQNGFFAGQSSTAPPAKPIIHHNQAMEERIRNQQALAAMARGTSTDGRPQSSHKRQLSHTSLENGLPAAKRQMTQSPMGQAPSPTAGQSFGQRMPQPGGHVANQQPTQPRTYNAPVAPMVPNMGSGGANTLDGTNDSSIQDHHSMPRGNDALHWSHWSNVAGKPTQPSEPSQPAAAIGNNTASMQPRAPSIARTMSNASSQHMPPSIPHGAWNDRMSMPPPGSPMLPPEHLRAQQIAAQQGRRDSVFSTMSATHSSSSPRLQGQYPVQQPMQRQTASSPQLQGQYPVQQPQRGPGSSPMMHPGQSQAMRNGVPGYNMPATATAPMRPAQAMPPALQRSSFSDLGPNRTNSQIYRQNLQQSSASPYVQNTTSPIPHGLPFQTPHTQARLPTPQNPAPQQQNVPRVMPPEGNATGNMNTAAESPATGSSPWKQRHGLGCNCGTCNVGKGTTRPF